MLKIIKDKLKKSDNQTNIDKYKEATDITEYHIISNLIFLNIIIPNIEDKAIISYKKCM